MLKWQPTTIAPTAFPQTNPKKDWPTPMIPPPVKLHSNDYWAKSNTCTWWKKATMCSASFLITEEGMKWSEQHKTRRGISFNGKSLAYRKLIVESNGVVIDNGFIQAGQHSRQLVGT